VTGIAIPELLRASHIKPWCDCEPKERLDPDNGLLLAVHIDGLFDRGFISFDENGRILISPKLRSENLKLFGISPDSQITQIHPGHHKYLALHRASHNFRNGAKI
jgi:predicted restriction endonuclease